MVIRAENLPSDKESKFAMAIRVRNLPSTKKSKPAMVLRAGNSAVPDIRAGGSAG